MWVKKHTQQTFKIFLIGLLGTSLLLPLSASAATPAAITPLPIPQPGSGSYGLQATKNQPPPTTGATISIPSNGATFTSSPIKVSGICPNGLLVEIYDNDVMVGSVDCQNGSFSLQVSLFSGLNVLSATVFDDLDQAGPVSNSVSVTYNDSHLTDFGESITLTSSYGRRGAYPGYTLTWPLELSGGIGPYAFSIDWGDGTPAQLQSQATTGTVNISHIYSKAGIYHVSIKATDSKGATAFLQVVAIANGNVSAKGSTSSGGSATATTKVLWLPTLVMFVMMGPAFWLGRQSKAIAMKRR